MEIRQSKGGVLRKFSLIKNEGGGIENDAQPLWVMRGERDIKVRAGWVPMALSRVPVPEKKLEQAGLAGGWVGSRNRSNLYEEVAHKIRP